MQFGRGDEQRLTTAEGGLRLASARRAQSCSRWVRWRLSTPASVRRVARPGGGHDLEEEIVAVAAGCDGWAR